jgi:hypothetical protein
VKESRCNREISLTDIVHCSKNLKKVERSPGGTPIIIRSATNPTTNTQDLIARALKEKLGNSTIDAQSPTRRHSSVGNSSEWDEESENKENNPNIPVHKKQNSPRLKGPQKKTSLSSSENISAVTRKMGE